jgi:hypothetical protein
VPPWLEREARQAVDMCPALALRLAAPQPALKPGVRDYDRRLTETRMDLLVSESWIAEISDGNGKVPRQIS